MAILYSSDISSANNAEGFKELSFEYDRAAKIINALQEFIDCSSSSLQGEAWDSIRSRFGDCINACKQRQVISRELYDAISNSNTTLSNYMSQGPDDKADESEIPELESRKESIEREIEAINAENKGKLFGRKSTASLKAELNSVVNKLNWLEQLSQADSSSYSQLSSVDVSNFTGTYI